MSPYQSDAQRRFFHSPGAAKAGLSAAEVAKWDEESKGQTGLPERVQAKRRSKKAAKPKPRSKSLTVGRAGKVKRA
jgi:hypothetical protein